MVNDDYNNYVRVDGMAISTINNLPLNQTTANECWKIWKIPVGIHIYIYN